MWLLLGIVLAAFLVVLLVLPSFVAEPGSTSQISIVAPEQKASAEEPLEAAELLQIRQDAEQALQQFLRLMAQPDLSHAEIWAQDGWSDAMKTAERGDDEFGEGRFAQALNAYKEAEKQLQTILDGREQTLQQYLESGWKHLQSNAVEEAAPAFERAIAMQPDHQQAQLGRERTAVRNQVLKFVTIAEQAEITGDLQQAATAYISALKLDSLYSPAQEALEVIEFELRNLAFQEFMGHALEAIESRKFAAADKALLEAARIDPGSAAIRDARERLLSARRQASLDGFRYQAQQRAKKEDWAAAAENYGRALAIDSQAAFALNGIVLSQKRLQLHKQLDHYLADTTRLYSQDPLSNARKLLAANQQIPDNEPGLAAKLAKLQQAVTVASIPVDLIIFSDNLTLVTIYKVGRLGSFEQKQLSLLPGRYTVTGSRQGYRDVLKVIDLKPGMTGQSLKINTEEQI